MRGGFKYGRFSFGGELARPNSSIRPRPLFCQRERIMKDLLWLIPGALFLAVVLWFYRPKTVVRKQTPEEHRAQKWQSTMKNFRNRVCRELQKIVLPVNDKYQCLEVRIAGEHSSKVGLYGMKRDWRGVSYWDLLFSFSLVQGPPLQMVISVQGFIDIFLPYDDETFSKVILEMDYHLNHQMVFSNRSLLQDKLGQFVHLLSQRVALNV